MLYNPCQINDTHSLEREWKRHAMLRQVNTTFTQFIFIWWSELAACLLPSIFPVDKYENWHFVCWVKGYLISFIEYVAFEYLRSQ